MLRDRRHPNRPTSAWAGSSLEWRALDRSLAGEVVLPGSDRYETLRRPPIGRFRHVRPQAIVRCVVPADVAETLKFAAGTGLPLAVRSGGHCFAGHSSTTGLLLDVALMNSISVHDGLADIGAGARLGEVYDALDSHGVTIPAGCGPTVGVAGLALGGGMGVLGRQYGLTCDRLRAAEVVLADGRILGCGPGQHPNLFWPSGAEAGRVSESSPACFLTPSRLPR